jgi:hypothetical protein
VSKLLTNQEHMLLMLVQLRCEMHKTPAVTCPLSLKQTLSAPTAE